MPNWAENDVIITGPAEDIAALKALVGDRFDFNKIIPMPTAIDAENVGRTAGNTAAVRNERTKVFHLASGKHYKEIGIFDRISMKESSSVAHAINNGYRPCKVCVSNPNMRGQKFDRPIEEGAALVKEYGHDNWWDWRVNNWGTKWQPDIAADFGDKFVITHFLSAWSPPEPIYHKLVELFPKLDIKWHWSEPGSAQSGNLETGLVNDFPDPCDCDDPDCFECHPENEEN